ncbi:hypothetical protein JCM10212_000537 [Sporobolomyces blumeae]
MRDDNAKENLQARHLANVGKLSITWGCCTSLVGIGSSAYGLVESRDQGGFARSVECEQPASTTTLIRLDELSVSTGNQFSTLFGTMIASWTVVVAVQGMAFWTVWYRLDDKMILRVLIAYLVVALAGLASAGGLAVLWKLNGSFEDGQAHTTEWVIVFIQLFLFAFGTSPSLAFYYHYRVKIKSVHFHDAAIPFNPITRAVGSVRSTLSRNSSKTRPGSAVHSGRTSRVDDDDILPHHPEPSKLHPSSASTRRPLGGTRQAAGNATTPPGVHRGNPFDDHPEHSGDSDYYEPSESSPNEDVESMRLLSNKSNRSSSHRNSVGSTSPIRRESLPRSAATAASSFSPATSMRPVR